MKHKLDLFTCIDILPENLKAIVLEYSARYEEEVLDYSDTEEFLQRVETLGYTFDYYLDNQPHNLRRIA